MDSNEQSLIDEYELDEGDREAMHWRRMLDLESAAKVDADWYSLRTFEIFLDAIDINQPVIPEDKRSKPKVKGSLENITCKSNPELGNPTSPEKVNQEKLKQKHNAETILSAEALKILSELPDLSHMSTTRSFIFPNSKKKSPE